MIRANATNDMADEADLDSDRGPHISTPSLPAGCNVDVRAVVRGLRAECPKSGRDDG